jgi:hypothetical protein
VRIGVDCQQFAAIVLLTVDLRWLKGRFRRWQLVCFVAICAAGAAGASALAAGGASSAEKITTAGLRTFRTDLIARLHAQQLNYHWVACVRTPHRYRGVGVVRCNVDFGIDPHVEAYCSVLRGGQLLTSEQDPAIPCGHDNAGFSDPVVTFG